MKTKHKQNHIYSAFLAMVMLFSLCVPAFAATANDAIVLIYQDDALIDADARNSDGNKDLLTVGALEVESLTVNGVAVSQEEMAKTQSAASNLSVNGTDMSAGSYKVYTATTNGIKTVRLSWSNLSASLEVRLKTKAHSDFTVKADSVPASSVVYNAAQVQTVSANGTYRMTFTPRAAQLEINSLTIKAGGVSQSVQVPASGNTTVTVAGQEVTVTPTDNGAVRVEIFHVSQDTEITAQVGNLTKKYTLDVDTDSTCRADVGSVVLEEGTSKSVTLTPNSGYNIGAVTLYTGTQSVTIRQDETSAKMNGQTFEVSRRLDGSAVLKIPAMKADVDVFVQSANDTYFISVDSGKYARSEQDGTHYVRYNEPFVVTFEAKSDASLMSVKATTASGTFRADAGDDYLVVNGVYNKIYSNRDGVMTIYFYDLRGNMKIEAEARDSVHDVDVNTDSRTRADTGDTTIDDGKDMAIVFTPDSGYDVRTIRITYGGTTYKADPATASYIRVDGVRWDMKTSSDGSVTLYMVDVMDDVDVFASTKKNDSTSTGRNYSVSKSTDSHSNISVRSGSSYAYGDDVRIRVYTDKNYVIKTVRFTMNGKTAEIEPFESYFTLDGDRYDVDWDTDADFTVDMRMYGNLTVRATSEKGTAQEGSSDARYRITTSPSSRSKITVNPNISRFVKGQAVSIKVEADKNYVLKTIKLTMNGKNVTVEPFSGSFKLDGKTYTIRWTSNRFCEISMNVESNVTVSTTTTKGAEKINTLSLSHPAYMSGYGNGIFGPSNNMTRAEAITLLCRVYASDNGASVSNFTWTSPYLDVPAGQWYTGYIGYAKSVGVLGTLTGGSYLLNPSQPITRAEFLALLCDFAGAKVTSVKAESRYTDVPASHWAVKYINYATDMGWVSGVGNGLFQPDRSVNRAEICVMVNQITGRIPNGANTVYPIGFSDVQPNHWAYGDIMEAANGHTVSSIKDGVEIWSK